MCSTNSRAWRLVDSGPSPSEPGTLTPVYLYTPIWRTGFFYIRFQNKKDCGVSRLFSWEKKNGNNIENTGRSQCVCLSLSMWPRVFSAAEVPVLIDIPLFMSECWTQVSLWANSPGEDCYSRSHGWNSRGRSKRSYVTFLQKLTFYFPLSSMLAIIITFSGESVKIQVTCDILVAIEYCFYIIVLNATESINVWIELVFYCGYGVDWHFPISCVPEYSQNFN